MEQNILNILLSVAFCTLTLVLISGFSMIAREIRKATKEIKEALANGSSPMSLEQRKNGMFFAELESDDDWEINQKLNDQGLGSFIDDVYY